MYVSLCVWTRCVCMFICRSVHAQCEGQRSNFATPCLPPETGSLCCSMLSKPALQTCKPLRILQSLSPMPLSEHRDYRNVFPHLLFTWGSGYFELCTHLPMQPCFQSSPLPLLTLSPLLFFCLSPSLLRFQLLFPCSLHIQETHSLLCLCFTH